MSRFILILGLALLSFPVLALAGPPPEVLARAKVHFEAGTRHYDIGSYDEAASEFQKAYALSEHPELLYNVYSAFERAGRYPEAAEALERYLELGSMEDTQRESLEARLGALRARLTRESSPEPDPPAGDQDSPSQGSRSLSTLAVASYATAGGMALTFGVVGGLALKERRSLEAACGATRSCTPREVRKSRALNATADVALAAGVAALATAVIATFVKREPRKAEVSFFADGESRGLVLRGSF